MISAHFLDASELEETEEQVKLHVLGPLRATYRGQPLDLGPLKQRRLLVALILKANNPVSREEIIESVWHRETPNSVVNLVYTYVARLRRILDPGRSSRKLSGLIVSTPTGYLLQAGADQLDLLEFNRLSIIAKEKLARGHFAESFEVMQRATELWSGGVAEDVPPAASEHSIAPMLRQQYNAMLVDLTHVASQLGRSLEVVPALTKAIQCDPLHENLHSCLMLALASSGQQAAAVRLFEEIRDRLREELGLSPGPDLQRTFQQILLQEV
ncbi:AfsR/SARP family transcriptional regulator [Nocardia iowensis]|uniref:Winged helix-turn-helix domain-containing protein n=1 Tax=Nocardia iowensis TaxID=204891 RepID=A0ABX8RM81_NOCIO|nr:BTAD domain-containing putative transcriptional regulator [Nocardia iowensis]QXN90738.1 winged helix-turn-helix domain-containing protein [Nocardia iowensis]